MNKPKVLVFSCVAPLPTNRGDRVRICNMLSLLRDVAEVRLVCLQRDWEPHISDWSVLGNIDVRVLTVTKREVVWEGIKAFVCKRPYIAYRFATPRVVAFVQQQIKDYQPDFFWAVGIYAFPVFPYAKGIKRVFDLVDSPSMFGLLTQTSRDVSLAIRLQSIIQWRLREVEAAAIYQSDHVIVCSQPNADYLQHTHGSVDHVVVIPNSVPRALLDHQWTPATAKADRVLFVGNLSYGPNMTAVRYFIEQVLPHIQAQRPFVEFVICGPNSETMAQEYRTRSGVHFYGFVDDLISMYLSARVQVVPVSFASGIQTKLIESMAVGLPAVVSPQSAKANGVMHARQVLVADSPQAFANAVLQVIDDDTLASQLSTQGRAFVREHFTLEHQRPLIAELLAH